jgi:hypothetical protein
VGSFFQRVFENALQTVAPFFHGVFENALQTGQEKNFAASLRTPVSLSSLASEIQPRATELCSLPSRDQITGRGSNTTQVAACDLASYINYDL